MKPTTEETIEYFNKNIRAVRDTIYVNVPTAEEVEKLATTKSGLLLKGKTGEVSYNEFLHTVLAVGNKSTTIESLAISGPEDSYKPGDKIYLKVKVLDQQMIDGHAFAVVSPFQVIGIRN